MKFEQFIKAVVEEARKDLKGGFIEIDAAVVPMDGAIYVPSDPGENRSLSRIRLSVKIDAEGDKE